LTIALFLVGFGHVARRFVEMLDESSDVFSRLGVKPIIAGVATRSNGGIFRPEGFTRSELTAFAAARPAEKCDTRSFVLDSLRGLREGVHPGVLVEATTLNIADGEPAITHLRSAFAHGIHGITANKGPAAFAYRQLDAEARAAGVSFLFEGAVRETMPGVVVNGFRGVVNSTTNYLLTAMESGEPFDAALLRMQQAGVAEADPSLDVDGWDAAAKTAVLANVFLDGDLTPHKISRQAVTAETGIRARDARANGRRLKVVVSGDGRGNRAAGRVELLELAPDDPLAILPGQANALELDTTPLGRIVITQRDGGLEKTAYALVTDLVTVARRCGASESR
jgi:homoserine dehydrogenase